MILSIRCFALFYIIWFWIYLFILNSIVHLMCIHMRAVSYRPKRSGTRIRIWSIILKSNYMRPSLGDSDSILDATNTLLINLTRTRNNLIRTILSSRFGFGPRALPVPGEHATIP